MSDYLIHIFILAGVNAIASLGLYLSMSIGQWSIAHATFMGIGGYAAGLLARGAGVGLLVTLPVAFVAAAIVGMLVSAITAKLGKLFLSIMTVVFAQSAVVTFSNIEAFGGAKGLYPIPTSTNIFIVIILLVGVCTLAWWYDRSRWRYEAHLLADDPDIAATVGIRVARFRIVGFGVGAGVAAMAGALLAQYVGIVEPQGMGFSASMLLFVYVVFGGTGVWYGGLVGALALTLVPELLRFTLVLRYMFMGVVLLAIMVLRPQGLFRRRPLKVLGSRNGGTLGAPPNSTVSESIQVRDSV